MENIGYEKIREILSEDDLSANVKNLIEFGQKTKKDDCTVQVLEIKAKTPPVAPSSPDTLTPEEEIIVDEIEKFVIDGESPKPEEARYIYEVVKNSGKFEDSKGDVDLILIESSLTSKFNSEIFSFEGDQIDKWINSI